MQFVGGAVTFSTCVVNYFDVCYQFRGQGIHCFLLEVLTADLVAVYGFQNL